MTAEDTLAPKRAQADEELFVEDEQRRSLEKQIQGAADAMRAARKGVEAANRRRSEPFPYRPALDDPWTVGSSGVIELPVSGNLGGGNTDGQIEHFLRRLEGGPPIDVFQNYWHHFEFAGLGWTRGAIPDAERFLVACAEHEGVVFSTAAQAAKDLERNGL